MVGDAGSRAGLDCEADPVGLGVGPSDMDSASEIEKVDGTGISSERPGRAETDDTAGGGSGDGGGVRAADAR